MNLYRPLLGGGEGASKASIAIIVVNFGSDEILAKNFAWADGSSEIQMVVVDNFKSRQDLHAIREKASVRGWHLVELGQNRGYGSAVNRGIAAASWADVIVVVNPDVSLSVSDARCLAALSSESPSCLVTPRIRSGGRLASSGLLGLDLRTGRVISGAEYGPRWVSGACFAVQRDLWNRFGGFDEDYFMYWEDVDLGYRWGAAGLGFVSTDDVVITHSVGATQSGTGDSKSTMYYRMNCRNRLLFAAKNLPWPVKFLWIVHTPSDVRRVLTRGSLTKRGKFIQGVWPASIGVLSGIGRIGISRFRRQ